MSTVNISIQGLNELKQRLNSLPDKLTTRIDAELKDGAATIATEAKNRAPANTGILRNLIGSDKVAALSYEVFSGAEYSGFIEFGTGTFVSIPAGLEEYASQFVISGGSALSAKEAIFQWCKDKGIDEKAWYAIYITIMRAGIHPQPFFFPAKDRQEPIIIERVGKAVQAAVDA